MLVVEQSMIILTAIDMNNESSSQASSIIDQTTRHLDDKTLKQLLISVQHVNVTLCVKYAIEEYDLLVYIHSSSNYWIDQPASC